MKGLLTKDFALFLQRKKIFLFLAVWAVVMCIIMDDGSFIIGWMTVIMAFFSVSSLTYDEYDNCYPFLMLLPINEKVYVLEKYLFGFLFGICGWVFSTVLYLLVVLVKGRMDGFGTELVQLAVFIPLFLLLIDVSLPLDLKFGSEKGRMIILLLWGVVFLGIFVFTKFEKNGSFFINDSGVTGGLIIAVSFLAAVLLTVISVFLSIRIMSAKDY